MTDGEVLESKHRNAMIEQIGKNEEVKIEIELTEECIKTIIAAGYNPEELTVEEARAITQKESEKVPVVKIEDGGSDDWCNLILIHKDCHKIIHKSSGF